ncbi:toxin-antitoxin system YwqK family antitoxin [Fusobacterium ulcerans]|uniref:toxin-antitoxin system YwqK family antitoxin n=1 Tax=Fusobacterium ulcerans TaxID=861 RepID=UPI003FEFCC2C
MKVYKIDFSFDNNEPVFGAKENFKIENSKFTKEEIVDFLNWIDINDFSLMDEIKMRERRNMSISDLKIYINLMTEDKISELPDMMYIAGFGETILLSEKAKEYIPKKYKDKNIEYLEVYYKNIPLYIMNVMESEECYVKGSPEIDDQYMLDFSKIKDNDIFRAREVGNFKRAILGIYCNENFKKYIEKSDLKGYKFIEIRDINDGIPMQEEKEEYIFKEEPTRELYPNGNLKYEGTIWKGYRINKWRYFHEDGSLEMEGNFGGKDAEILEIGEQTGEWKYYYKNGNIKTIGYFKKGKKKGIFKTYDEADGSLWLEQYYETGEENELIKCKFYYKNGQIEKEGTAYERNNWEISGEWKYYDMQGNLKKIEIYDKNDLIETKTFD